MRELTSILGAALLTLTIGGCVSTQEHAAALAAADAKCQSFGFQKGTSDFAECRMQIDQTRQSNGAESNLPAAQATVDAGVKMLTPPPVPPMTPMQPNLKPQPLRCTSTPVGGTVVTNCQ